MRYILTILFVIIGISAFAQSRMSIPNRSTDSLFLIGYKTRVVRQFIVDSMATNDTNVVAGFDANGKMVKRTKSNAPSFDTTGLLRKTDTSRNGIVVTYWVLDSTNRNNVKYSDTATKVATQYQVDTAKANIRATHVPYIGAINDVDLDTYELTADAIQYNTSPSISTATGKTYWDITDQTLATVLDNTAGVILQHGQENHVRAVNKTGVQINDGQVVFVSGAQGNRPTITLAQADSVHSSYVIGVATQNIADNAEGFVTTQGIVHGYNTSLFTDGEQLYLSPTVAGALTNSAPSPPYNLVSVGVALNSTVNGKIYVHPAMPISLDTNLGNSNAIVSSQAAVKSYVDNGLATTVKYGDTTATITTKAYLNNWAGSTNITTLGTVSTGTWNATTISTGKGGTGLASIGTANQLLGVNNGATGLEYKTINVGTSGTDFDVAHASNTVTLNLPDASSSARGAVTTSTQTFAGNKTFNGSVGVGAAPIGKFDVTGSGAAFEGIGVRNTTGTGYTYMVNARDPSGGGGTLAWMYWVNPSSALTGANAPSTLGLRNDLGGISIVTAAGAGSFKVYTGGVGSSNMRMEINQSGRVLIKTSVDAGFDCDVNGTLRAATSVTTPTINNGANISVPTVGGIMTAYKTDSTTSSATPTPTGDAKDNFYKVTALATAPTFAAPSGTARDGNTLLIRIKDNGTARALSWNAIYRGGTTIPLPTTTTVGKTMYVQFAYNSADTKWDLIGLTDGL